MRTGSTPLLSAADSIRRDIASGGDGRWWRTTDFPHSPRSIECELSRLAAAGELLRMRKGLYWRGHPSRFGMTPPSVMTTGIEIAGRGSGPAGVAAAALLGLTTQTPSIIDIAVPGRCPSAIAGVRFRQRPIERRERNLSLQEVAALEVLRDPTTAEKPWGAVVERVREWGATGRLRLDVMTIQIADESHVKLRERWLHVIG